MKNTLREFLKVPALVFAGLFYWIGYIVGIIWVPFAEGMDDGISFVDDDVIGYLYPELDEDDTK